MAAASTYIDIEARDKTEQVFHKVGNSFEVLEKQARDVSQATRATAAALGLVGNEANESAIGVTNLGRSIFRTSAEAKQFGGVFQDSRGRLREANGTYAKTNETVEKLGRTFQRTGGRAGDLDKGMQRASGGANLLTRSVGSLSGVLGALGIAAVTHEIGRFGITSIQTAGRLDQLQRALVNIEGSSEAAQVRFESLIEVANRPGLQLEPLVRYANRLSAAGFAAEDADKILLTTGQTILALGGSAATAELAMEQLIQAIQLGKPDMRDFRTVIQQIPGYLEAMADVHGVEANIDGLHEAFARVGGSMRDLLIPVFDELERRFEAPPDNSYIVVMDTLENAFTLFQGAVGDLFLPTIIDAAMSLSNFFEAARAGLKDIDVLPEPIRDIVIGAKDLYDGLLNAAEAIASSVGPEIRELASSLATLLGGVLDLAGSIANVLTPVWEVWGQINATMIALITKLAQDLGSLIGVLTDFVDWVGSAWREEDKFTESTNRVTEAIENVEKATSSATQSTQEYQGSLRTILIELASVNAELEQKQARLDELKSEGLEPTDASMAQIVRRIGLLEERSKSLTGSLPDLNKALEDVNEQLEDKKQRLDEMREGHEGGSASAQQLQRQIANLTTLATLLNVQIALTPPALDETSEGMNTATEAVENYSLTLARLKAEAEDARDTLSNTINFEQLSTNYQASIAASDAYYSRQIANAQAALSEAEANSEEYHKIETDLFNLRRDREEARKKLTEQASAVARTEAEKRIATANEVREKLQKAGEETARALAASQKQQADAAEANQKRLTEIHEANLKAREEAERASNERIVKDSEEQLAFLGNAFENALPTSVDTAYENIQRATVAHYETLKNQARQRITDEDALNAELVSLDRQRNAALEDNHRNFLQRIASDAKDLLGERTEAFKSESDEILHNWERTVSEFERQLREADTEDAIREIEADFETAQQAMLASLESVLTELGFTADETAEIMKSIFRTAEGESDSFADKVISAFKRLGKEADRETKQQNRQIERNYRELVREIEGILSGITDFFIEVTRGGDIEDAFRQLGERVAGSFLDVFTRDMSENLAASLSSIASETDVAGAAANRGGGAGGAGGAIQAAGGLTSILSLITSPVALAAIIPAAVGAATYYIGKQVAGNGTDEPVNRQGRPVADDHSRRRRGESQTAYENRLQARADSEAATAERETFFGNYDPRAPFGRAIQETGIFTGDTGYFAEAALRQTEVDPFGRVDLPGLVEDLEGILQTRVEGLGEDMERAAASLASASGVGIGPALDDYFSATTDFYQTQIDFANFVRRTTGHLDFGDVEGLSRQLQQSLNEGRSQAPALDSSTRYNLYQSYLRNQGAVPSQENIDEYNALADEQGGVRYTAPVDDATLAAALQANQESVEVINTAITALENTISQSNDPAEIASLLQQIAQRIPERYRLRREALQRQLDANKITQTAFDTAIAQLNSDESAELERNSDAMLANTIRMINDGIGLINASILSVNTQIDQSNDPAEIAELLSRIPDLIQQKYQMLRDALDARYNAGEISVDAYNASLSELQSNESAELEQHSDAVLANTLRAIDEDVQRIDASISSIQTQIDGLSEPEAIVERLNQLPALISEKYQKFREALDARYAAGEISVDVYNASLTALTTNESAEIEQHSDAVLSTTLLAIDEDVALIDASITSIETQISQTSEPEAIVALLGQLPALITEKYRRLREALDAKYAVGEISTDVYTASLSELESGEAAETERHSDAVLAQTLADIDDDVQLIDANIGALQLAVENSDDPEAIAGLLDAIKILIADKYKRLRERLDELYAAEEISTDSYNAALTGLSTAESKALAGIDTQAFNAISEAAQDQVDFINGAIENLRLSLELTDDPTESQRILDAIKVLVGTRFDVLIEELNAIKDTLTDDQFDQALKGLELGKQVALENIDTEKFDTISAAAARQVDFINGSIENLRLSFELTDDPTEAQQILDAIKVLTAARFQILRDELNAIKDTLKPEEFEQALKGINLGEQLALQNLDTEKFDVISAEAQKQVDFINGNIENLRLSLQLTDNPAEQQDIITAIKVLTVARFKVLRDELEKIKGNLDPEEFDQALRGLNLGEQLAIQNIDTEKFNLISQAAKEQVDFINGAIENLRLSFELSDDPAEREGLLETIKILTRGRFRILREELEKIKESLTPAEYNQAIQSINLGEQLALKNIDTEKFAVISETARGQVDSINTDIENLRLSLEVTDDPEARQGIIAAIRALTVNRFQVLREELEKIKDSFGTEAEYNQAVKGVNLAEQVALKNLDTEKFSEISAAAQKQVDTINTDIEQLRISFQLTDDPAERQSLLTAIRALVVNRFKILREELIAIRDTFEDDADFQRALKGLNLGEQLSLKNLDTEKFDLISEAAQKQVSLVDGHLSNLELSLQLTDNPVEIQTILNSIRILTAKRFEILIAELKKIEDSFDSDEEFGIALKGLELGRDVALRGIDTRSTDIVIGQIDRLTTSADDLIAERFEDLEEQTTASGVREAIEKLRSAILAKNEVVRTLINNSAESEEEKARQIKAADLQTADELAALERQGVDAFSSLVDTAQFLLDNATESEFASRREALITAINTFYDARIDFINGLDLSDTDRENMLEVVRIQRRTALDAIPQMHESVEERLEMEKELQEDIAEIRDEQVENEQARQDKITEIHRKAARDREDIQRKFGRDVEDILRDAGANESFFLSGDFQQAQRLAQLPDTSILDDFLSQRGIELSDSQLDSIRGLGIERLRDQQNVDIRESRAEQDAINEAEQTALALRDVLAPLLTEDSRLETAAQTQTTAAEGLGTAATAQETSAMDLTGASTTQKTAAAVMETASIAQTDAATLLDAAALAHQTAADVLLIAGDSLIDAAAGLDFGRFASVLDSAAIRFEVAIESIGSQVAEALSNIEFPQLAQPLNVEVKPQNINLDGDTIGQVAGDNIRIQQQTGRSLI